MQSSFVADARMALKLKSYKEELSWPGEEVRPDETEAAACSKWENREADSTEYKTAFEKHRMLVKKLTYVQKSYWASKGIIQYSTRRFYCDVSTVLL